MGSIAFSLPTPLPTVARATLDSAVFTAGEEQVPVPTAREIQGDKLIADWNLSESRYLSVPWPVGPFGTLVATTATLRERPTPYRLLVELARGKLNQVRTWTAEWQSIGLKTPPDYEHDLSEATRSFARALNAPAPECDQLAARVLEQSFALADRLVREYVGQMFDVRHSEEGPLETRLAVSTVRGPGPRAADYGRSFNAARIALPWQVIEPEESRYDWSSTDAAVAAARAAGLPITAGPIIDLAAGMLPDWVAAWEGDLPALAAFMCDYLETVINRYRGDVRRWVVCAGFNHADAIGLDDDERLRLAFRLFEAASHVDPELDLVMSVAQPWGDYLAREEHTISPVTFPDDLIRAGLKVSAIELEIRPGCVPRGSLPRDLLDTVQLLNLFSLLGLPLELLLSYPATSQADPLSAAHGQSLWSPAWRTPPTPEGQAEWGASFAAVGLCTPQVRAVTWDNWSDSEPHLTPGSGLIDAAGRVRPLLARLHSLRATHLA